MSDEKNLKAVVEGLLFLSGMDGLTIDEISNIIELDQDHTKEIIKNLYKDYESSERGLQIEFLGEHFKLTTKNIHKDFYKKLTSIEENSPLSNSALETLAIIAYNSPITRVDVDEIRGVNSSYVVRKLLLKGLIEEAGRSDAPGRPRLYKTTNKFLDYFGLGSLEELPKIEPKEVVNDEENLFESKYTEEN